jgi:hypothetical protein
MIQLYLSHSLINLQNQNARVYIIVLSDKILMTLVLGSKLYLANSVGFSVKIFRF